MKLEDLKKLCDEATSGPWSYRESGSCGGTVYRISPSFTDSGSMAHADAAFIAAARTYMPKLIAVVEAAKSLAWHYGNCDCEGGEPCGHCGIIAALDALEKQHATD